MAPASGMGLSSETRFGFRYTVRLWAFGLYVRESIANAGMPDSFGIVHLSKKQEEKQGEKPREKPGEKPGGERKHCMANVRGLETRWQEDSLFSF